MGSLKEKVAALREFADYARSLSGRPVVMCGTFNIAHKNIDLSAPMTSEDKILFMQEERRYLDDIIKSGFVDTFRIFNQDTGCYTCWHSLNDRDKNVGHRIDYIFVSKDLVPYVKGAFTMPDVKGSDHCPVGIEMEL